jgi:hypothetical protein
MKMDPACADDNLACCSRIYAISDEIGAAHQALGIVKSRRRVLFQATVRVGSAAPPAKPYSASYA